MTAIQPIILCGGSGSRLWPLSREQHPKQLLQLAGDYSLFQDTVARMADVDDLNVLAPLVVCNEEYRFIIAEQLRTMDITGTLLLEPEGRNTAPALTLGALESTRDETDPILLVMPADHVITDIDAFQAAVRQGVAIAETNTIATFGIEPSGPETGYGYIQSGDRLSKQAAFAVKRFVEKPEFDLAQRYIAEGNYLWNSGLFLMRASVWLATIDKCRQDIAQACREAWSDSRRDGDFIRIDELSFKKCPSDSIDYAVMERLTATDGPPAEGHPPIAVIPLDAGWSDIGAWDALLDVLPRDKQGNVTRGDVLMQDSTNTFAYAQSRLVTCVGVDGLIVVETADAIMVAHKDHSQDVKKIVKVLNQKKRRESLNHRKVYRPWGYYDSIDAGDRFQVKRIMVKPGASLSLQMHHHRAEHWIVVSGTAEVTRGHETFLVAENESTYIPIGMPHRLHNPGHFELEMIEVQSGSYLEEDDIVRFEDAYGRVPA